jgi:hypothetical protein
VRRWTLFEDGSIPLFFAYGDADFHWPSTKRRLTRMMSLQLR